MAFSLAYAPPEVIEAWEGNQATIPVSAAVDMWAVGVIAVELLCGERLFPRGTSEDGIRDAIIGRSALPWEHGAARPNAVLKNMRGLRRSILQCLDRDPSKRPSAEDLRSSWDKRFDEAQSVSAESSSPFEVHPLIPIDEGNYDPGDETQKGGLAADGGIRRPIDVHGDLHQLGLGPLQLIDPSAGGSLFKIRPCSARGSDAFELLAPGIRATGKEHEFCWTASHGPSDTGGVVRDGKSVYLWVGTSSETSVQYSFAAEAVGSDGGKILRVRSVAPGGPGLGWYVPHASCVHTAT